VEDALKHAVLKFRESSPTDDREANGTNVRNLTKRLLQARIRLLETRIVRASETRMTGRARASPSNAADLKRGTRRPVFPNV
jgi:hypothetical protein